MTDLRSQQVRDICLFLVALAEVIGDRMKFLLRDTFAFILEGVKVPNKVMSGFVDECIILLIRHCVFKNAIPTLVSEVKDNKAKQVREKCMVNTLNMHASNKHIDILHKI